MGQKTFLFIWTLFKFFFLQLGTGEKFEVVWSEISRESGVQLSEERDQMDVSSKKSPKYWKVAQKLTLWVNPETLLSSQFLAKESTN